MTNERFTVERADSGSCDAVLVDAEQGWKTVEICFGSQGRVDAIEAQLAGSAAPSEGDGRREAMGGTKIREAMDAGKTVEFLHTNGQWITGREWFAKWSNKRPGVQIVARIVGAEPDAPPAPLPPGVHRAPNGALWLLPGAKMPEGYEFRLSRFHAWGTPIPTALAEPVWSDQARELRPAPVPPVPEPEKVPWAEAIWNKRLIARTFEGREPFVAMFVDDATGTEFAATLEKIITDGDGYEPIDADGLVSVLPLGDPK